MEIFVLGDGVSAPEGLDDFGVSIDSVDAVSVTVPYFRHEQGRNMNILVVVCSMKQRAFQNLSLKICRGLLSETVHF